MDESLTNDDPVRSFTITRRNGDQYTVWVSVVDYDRVMAAGPWHLLFRKSDSNVYVVRHSRSEAGRTHQYMHRFIMGEPSAAQVDHVNVDGLDNRRSNLRLASPSQNQHNKRLQRNNKTLFKGVSFCPKRKTWYARIKLHRKTFRLGTFNSPEAAAFAYLGASLLLHGEFSRVR